MSNSQIPVYFENSWSILSTLGLLSAGISCSVGCIIGWSALSFVPLVTSIACAIANGLCFYANYTNYARNNRIVAGVFADVAWLIQEAGLSFYSYQILRRLLRSTERRIFMSLFWLGMSCIAILRMSITVERALSIARPKSGDASHQQQQIINHLHVAYFILIATAECLCAYFLLRIFRTAQRSSITALGTHNNLFRMLARSSEIRLALLGPIGVCRSITYTFQATAQSATNTASQLDRFAYSLECMFPIILIVDLLASKRSVDSNRPSGRSAHGYSNGIGNSNQLPHGMWSRVVTSSTGGKNLQGDEISLTPPAPPNQILTRTQIRQSVVRLDNVDERSTNHRSSLDSDDRVSSTE